MKVEYKGNALPSHKILLVTKSPIVELTQLFSSLQKEGIESTFIEHDKNLIDVKTHHSQCVWIHTEVLTHPIISSVMEFIPELSGVLFFFDQRMSRLEILKEIAIARTHYVAIVGAIFLIDSPNDKDIGVDICRRSGIPYLFSAIKKEEGKAYVFNEETISILTNMVI
ncbi:MAG: hypothetical protein EOM67_11970 [Spirochaetia bacterium]|nr:hypothetical protein [Spirochaetia bacterium]